MSRYVVSLIYCDHRTGARICNGHVSATDGDASKAEFQAHQEGWLFTGGEQFCPAHRAEHAPPPVKRPRLAKAEQQTLEDVAPMAEAPRGDSDAA